MSVGEGGSGNADFWSAAGFWGNPFESTNAGGEEYLAEYFLDPPYFEGVLGDENQPRPSVVFAPRGCGKTAQRRTVETRAPEAVLTVTHDQFPLDSWGGIDNVTLGAHVTVVNQLVLVGLVSKLATEPEFWKQMSEGEQDAVRAMLHAYLSDVDSLRLQPLLRSLSSLRERQVEFLKGLTVQVGTLASYAWASFAGVSWPGPLNLPERAEAEFEQNALSDFQLIGDLAGKVGLKAIYVLVDGIDETPATQNDVRSAYKLVAPLLESLGTIETFPYAFKFFLPSPTRDIWVDAGGRQDRVTPYEMEWSDDALLELARRRVDAFKNKGEGLDLSWFLGAEPWSTWALTFAEGSPRNFIRLLRRYVDEAVRAATSPSGVEITNATRTLGIDGYSYDRALELCTSAHLNRIKRVGLLDFTIAAVAAALEVQPDAARRHVRAWEARGVVSATIDKASPGATGRPEVTYVITSVNVARHVLPETSLDDLMTEHVRYCAAGHPNLRDWEMWDDDSILGCISCGTVLT